METTKINMIDEVTSEWLRGILTKEDKLVVCEKTNYSYAYINMILNRERYNEDIVKELEMAARKKEKSKK